MTRHTTGTTSMTTKSGQPAVVPGQFGPRTLGRRRRRPRGHTRE
jgi:hypothetical protein